MALVVYKYHIETYRHTKMPSGAKFLKAGLQNGRMMVWALVDPTAAAVKRNFSILATGEVAPNYFTEENYIDTVFADNGLVWHIFHHGEEL